MTIVGLEALLHATRPSEDHAPEGRPPRLWHVHNHELAVEHGVQVRVLAGAVAPKKPPFAPPVVPEVRHRLGRVASFDPYTSDLRFVGVSSPSIRKYIFTENTARTRQHMEILEYDLIERI